MGSGANVIGNVTVHGESSVPFFATPASPPTPERMHLHYYYFFLASIYTQNFLEYILELLIANPKQGLDSVTILLQADASPPMHAGGIVSARATDVH